MSVRFATDVPATPPPPMASVDAAPLLTLRQRVDAVPLPPTPTSLDRRLTDNHSTGYPSVVNRDILCARAQQETDFSPIDPLAASRRKAEAIRRKQEEARAAAGHDSTAGGTSTTTTTTSGSATATTAPLMTTMQINARLTRLGTEMQHNPAHRVTAKDAIPPRGYKNRHHAPPYDGRSTYRRDYEFDDPANAEVADRTRQVLETYQAEWSEDDKSNVLQSMKQPYLTMPETILKGRRTIYRAGFMPSAEEEDFRTLSHKTHLPALGTTFAYSAYTVDDPRRAIDFDPAISHVEEQRRTFEQPHSGTAAASVRGPRVSAKAAQTAKEELEKLRAMRRETLMKSTNAAAAASAKDAAGLAGTGTQRRAPKKMEEGREYIFLPQDAFRVGESYDP